jgi:hypothetical protein
MLRLTLCLALALPCLAKTVVTIKGDQFLINGKPTYAGRTWNGHRIEGLLMNSRVVQATYDDLNPETAKRWAYKDTGKWDAERNVREFLAALPEYRKHGLLGITVNLQGGSPEGYSKAQPWHNSAIDADGSLRPDYLGRMKRVIDKADSLGMAVILGIFYFGQDQRLTDEAAILRAVDNTVAWVKKNGWRNVLIEADNETNVAAYDHEILKPARVHELIERVRKWGLLAGTSYGGGAVPKENVVRASDFILIHGNGVKDPKRISEMVRQTRAVPGYRPMPIVFNEDDHFDFDAPDYNMLGAIREYASWGYFDPEGYQSPPVNWGLDTERKKSFFRKLKEVTGEK